MNSAVTSQANAKRVQKKKKRYSSTNDLVMDIVVGVLLGFIVIVTLYPLIYVVSCSISAPSAVLTGEVVFLPVRPTLMSYQKLIEEGTLNRGLVNSIFYTVVGTLINLILTSTGAYALSEKKLAGRKLITALIMFTMMFSGGLVPTYLVVKQFHMLNTVWSLLIPNAIGVTNFMIMKNTFENSIPMELKEAAYVEGASQARIFVSIVLPLSKAIFAVMFMYYCVGHWNEYFNALLYITNESLQPLQVVLRRILISNEINQTISDGATIVGMDRMALGEGLRYAIIVVSSIPMILLYPFFQRYFTKGVMVGAVKG